MKEKIDFAKMPSNVERIMAMAEDTTYSKCPNCKKWGFPRYRVYTGALTNSNLYWCPKCFKGKAACFWETHRTSHQAVD